MPLSLRIAVEGGGCSGFQYTYTLEPSLEDAVEAEEDRVFIRDGVSVIVDETSLDCTFRI